MKRLKLYEDFDWDFDEEEFNDEITVGDIVKVSGEHYYRSRSYGDGLYKFESSFNIEIIFSTYIVTEIENYNGIKIMKIKKNISSSFNWPWYLCEYWEKI
jgi:hypothetical protein